MLEEFCIHFSSLILNAPGDNALVMPTSVCHFYRFCERKQSDKMLFNAVRSGVMFPHANNRRLRDIFSVLLELSLGIRYCFFYFFKDFSYSKPENKIILKIVFTQKLTEKLPTLT